MKSGDDDSSSSSSSLLEIVEQLNDEAIDSLQHFDFSDAANLFKKALDILVKNFGKRDARCADAHYKYGLALLYVQFPPRDPMPSVPKEIHYLLSRDGIEILEPGNWRPHMEKEKEKVDMQIYHENLQAAREELMLALEIISKGEVLGNSMEKVNILSALGEVAFRQGKIGCHYFYDYALQMLKELVEPDNFRIAHINFKLCLWMEQNNMTANAITYCEKALSVAETRHSRLTAEVESQPKGYEILLLADLCKDFQSKLDQLKKDMFRASTFAAPDFNFKVKVDESIRSLKEALDKNSVAMDRHSSWMERQSKTMDELVNAITNLTQKLENLSPKRVSPQDFPESALANDKDGYVRSLD